MALESQLEILKEEIVEMHRESTSEAAHTEEEVSARLTEKMLAYETLSTSYNELFKDVLEDGMKMKEGYAGLKK